jgi:hypothetical protein
MKFKTRNWDISVLLVCWLLHIAGLVLTAAYYAAGTPFAFNEPADWPALFRGLPKVNWSAITQTVELFDWAVLALGPLGMWVAFLTSERKRRWLRVVFFALQPIVIYPGWAGMWILVMSPLWITSIDGEIIQEGWFDFVGHGLWVFASLWILVRTLRYRSTPSPIIGAVPHAT